jgi:anti-sigma B factor antagonist
VPDHLSIISIPVSGGVIVRVGGEIDMATEPELSKHLAGLNGNRVLLDLSDVRFIDSCGFRALLQAHQRSEADGGGLVISGVAPIAFQALHILGLDSILHITE